MSRAQHKKGPINFFLGGGVLLYVSKEPVFHRHINADYFAQLQWTSKHKQNTKL
jgi:hypothetical protein